MSTLSNIIKVTKEQYDKLRNGENVNGHTYDESALYLVEDDIDKVIDALDDKVTDLTVVNGSPSDGEFFTLINKGSGASSEWVDLADTKNYPLPYAKTSHNHKVFNIESTSADLEGNEFHVVVSKGHDTETKWADLTDTENYPLPYAKKSLETDVGNLSNTVGVHTTSINSMSSGLEGVIRDVSGLTTRIGAVEDDITSISSDLIGYDNKFKSLNSSVDALAGQVESCQSNITSVGTLASALDNSVNTLNVDVEVLQNTKAEKSGVANIASWMEYNELNQNILVEGDVNTYYPITISLPTSKSMPTHISIHKNLGSTTPNYSSNHENGTSSMWLIFEGRYTGWDGNGGYIKTLYRRMNYAELCAHAEADNYRTGCLIVWLRGGGCEYTISATNSVDIQIYYQETNIGSSTYPRILSPRITLGNLGIYSYGTGFCCWDEGGRNIKTVLDQLSNKDTEISQEIDDLEDYCNDIADMALALEEDLSSLTDEVVCDHALEITGVTGHEYNLAIDDQQMLLNKIQGQSLVANQYFGQNDLQQTEYGVTWVFNKTTNLLTISGTPTNTYGRAIFNDYTFIDNHKYLFIDTQKFTKLFVFDNNYNFLAEASSGSIFSIVNAKTNYYQLRCYPTKGQAFSITTQVQIIDLTQMFGVGNEPTTADEFYSRYSGGYIPYNEGTFKHSQCNLISTGRNLWDEEWFSGYWTSTGERVDVTSAVGDTYVSSENFISVLPNTAYSSNKMKYWCEYDINQNFIKRTQTANSIDTFITSSNCYYIKCTSIINYGMVYNNDIIVNVGSTALPYEPYKEEVISDIGELKAFDYIQNGKKINETANFIINDTIFLKLKLELAI